MHGSCTVEHLLLRKLGWDAARCPDLEQLLNLGGFTARMPVNICEAFLYNAEDCQFLVVAEAFEVGGDDKADVNFAALRESFYEASDGRPQTKFLQQRRVK